jgi:flavin-dependent dehydrogenase
VLTVGDSWACTNPSLGRGISFGLMHAAITAEAVAEHLADPYALVLAQDRLTRERLLPWYDSTAREDRRRATDIAAVVAGRPPVAADAVTGLMRDMSIAMMVDPDIFRAYLESRLALATPEELLARPGLAEHVSEVAAAQPPAGPFGKLGPDRSELLRMIA